MNIKEYQKKLLNNNLPIFYDSNHVLGTFNVKNDVETFMSKNISSYKVKKHVKIKKDGKNSKKEFRVIYTVTPELKFIQQWIFTNILSKLSVSEASHAFVKRKSLLTNAQEHNSTKKTWLLRLDITNFFESISFSFVKRIFKVAGYSNGASDILAGLCTYKGKLRQGFCCSPILANLFLTDFDENILNKISAYKEYNVKYTRYADDLFFSGEFIDNKYVDVVNSIKQIVGFYLSKKRLKIKKSKTNLQIQARKRITGLYLQDGKINVSKSYVKNIERELFYCEKYGISTHLRHSEKLDKMDFYKYIMGKCAFVKMVEQEKGNQLIERVHKLYNDDEEIE